MHIQFAPPFLPIHTALLAIAVAALVLTLYLKRELAVRTPRRLALAVMRTVLVVVMAVILLNPIVNASYDAAAGKLPFILLLDASRSMCTPDVGTDTRWNAAKRATIENRALIDDLSARYNLQVFTFTDKPETASTEALTHLTKPNGDRTNLGAAISDGVSAVQGASKGGGQALIVSDGHDTTDSFPLDAARAVKARGFAVSTMCVGKQIQQHDLRVVSRKPQVFAAPGQTIQLAAEIRDTGIMRTLVRAQLLRDGKPEASLDVVVEPGRKEISFPVTQNSLGLYRYAIHVSPVPDEQDTTNNTASIFLNVTKTRSRVLFLEGQPSWDSKFLVHTLRADPTVTVDVIYKLTNDRYFAVIGGDDQKAAISIPRTVDQMCRYDVIVFGKGFEEFYNDQGTQVLKQWISDRGGNVIFMRGRPDANTPALSDIEPLVWTDQQVDDLRLQLTQEGKAHPGFAFSVSEDAQTVVQKLPPLITATRVHGEKALSVVLARANNAKDDQTAQEMATVAYQRYGQGKVMAIVGQGMWRWAFLPPDLEKYSHAYNEFWSQTLRWLVSDSDFLPGQNVSVRADHSGYIPGETVTLLGYQRNRQVAPPSTLLITLPSGGVQKVATSKGDGRHADFTATYRPTEPGEYVVCQQGPGSTLGQAACVFSVSTGHEEDLNRSADPDIMRQIADLTGGAVIAPSDAASLPDRLNAVEQARQRKSEPHSVWDRPWVLALIFVLLGGEWWLRRKAGMA